MLQDYDVERALSGRSTCRSCGIQIPLNSWRLKYVTMGYWNHVKTSFYCRQCGLDIITDILQDNKKIYDRLKARLVGGN